MKNSNINLVEFLKNNPQYMEGNADLISAVNSGKAKQRKALHYVRRSVTLASSAPLVDNTLVKAVGSTSLTNGTLQKNSFTLVFGLGLGYCNGADTSVLNKRFTNNIFDPTDVAADPTDQDAGATGVQSAPVAVQYVPKELLDSEFKMRVGGETKAENLLTKNFFCENNVSQKIRASEENFLDLEAAPIGIIGGQVIEASLEFNSNTTTPSGNHIVELTMIGQMITW